MKTYLAIALSALSTLAAAQDVQFPVGLRCESVGDCIAGLPNFCDGSAYFAEPIVDPASYAAEAYDPSEVLTDAELATKIKLDFTDGDQYSFYFFEAQDMTALATGAVAKISGTYEDGFDWVNGYNTRAKFNISCTLAN